MRKTQGNFIALVQEPHLYKGSPSFKPSYCDTIVPKHNPSRAVLYVDKQLHAWPVMHIESRDCALAIIKIRNRLTLVASIYLDINDEQVIPNWLEDIMHLVKLRGLACLIGMDSNGHSELYGRETNKRGRAIEEFIATYKLTVENKGKTVLLKGAEREQASTLHYQVDKRSQLTTGELVRNTMHLITTRSKPRYLQTSTNQKMGHSKLAAI